jgi:hypothetical protein
VAGEVTLGSEEEMSVSKEGMSSSSVEDPGVGSCRT